MVPMDSKAGIFGADRRADEPTDCGLPPPAYLLMHRLTFQCVFKRHDSFIRAIWYRVRREAPRLSLLHSLLYPCTRARVGPPLTWRKHREPAGASRSLDHLRDFLLFFIFYSVSLACGVSYLSLVFDLLFLFSRCTFASHIVDKQR